MKVLCLIIAYFTLTTTADKTESFVRSMNPVETVVDQCFTTLEHDIKEYKSTNSQEMATQNSVQKQDQTIEQLQLKLASLCQKPWPRQYCIHWDKCNNKDGRRTIDLQGRKVEVRCRREEWLIFQRRRQMTKTNFNRNWTEYVTGFGNLDTDFWLGLENLHALTNNKDMSFLLIIVVQTKPVNQRARTYWAKYKNFRVANASDGYRLSLGRKLFNFPAMENVTNGQFYTADRPQESCPDSRFNQGVGWWNNCKQARFFPNGNVMPEKQPSLAGDQSFAAVMKNSTYGEKIIVSAMFLKPYDIKKP